jgi:elongation factor Ts
MNVQADNQDRMEITSAMIKTLRDKTGAGMMDCKRALESSAGNIEAAIEYLRKKGAAVAAKRADRTAKEGMIVTRVTPDGKTGVIVEVNAETDFVGRSEDFVGFANAVAEGLEKNRPESLEKALGMTLGTGKTVTQALDDLLAKVGEKIEVRRFQIVTSKTGVVSAYTHLGSKIGVLVDVAGIPADAAKAGIGRDVAMQIAAMNPMVVNRTEISKEMVEREQDIYRTQAKNEGKPAQVVDRIAQGKLEKFYQEVALLEQTFIKDPGKTVKEVLAESGKDAGVAGFVRFHLGEETK